MDDAIIAAVRAHANREAPRECCGLVVLHKGRRRYRPCRNVATGADVFEIDPADYAAAEDAGEIVAIAHSHVLRAPEPSQADRAGCEASGLPWLIVNHPVGHWQVLEPSGFKLPLLGREFVHGTIDCYGLIRDYYRETLGITLPDFRRADDWWLEGGDLYRDNFAAAGFAPVQMSALQAHDMIVMSIAIPPQLPQVPNHAGVYLGGNKILHHVQRRLSSIDVYGGWWMQRTTHCMRHEQVKGNP